MIRVAGPEHRSFVIATWVRSVVEVGYADNGLVHLYEPKLAEASVDAGNVWVDTSDGYTVNGWIAGKKASGGKPGLVHWIYVPPELRGFGVATRLVLETVGDKPEVSKCLRRMKRLQKDWTRLPLGKWNPYRVTEL